MLMRDFLAPNEPVPKKQSYKFVRHSRILQGVSGGKKGSQEVCNVTIVDLLLLHPQLVNLWMQMCKALYLTSLPKPRMYLTNKGSYMHTIFYDELNFRGNRNVFVEIT